MGACKSTHRDSIRKSKPLVLSMDTLERARQIANVNDSNDMLDRDRRLANTNNSNDTFNYLKITNHTINMNLTYSQIQAINKSVELSSISSLGSLISNHDYESNSLYDNQHQLTG